MHIILSAAIAPTELRIARLWPNTNWGTVWQNVLDTQVSESVKSLITGRLYE